MDSLERPDRAGSTGTDGQAWNELHNVLQTNRQKFRGFLVGQLEGEEAQPTQTHNQLHKETGSNLF